MTGFGVVVVGIDGSAVADSALLFAAREARRRASRLIIAHGGKHPSPEDHTDEVRPFTDILADEAVAMVAAREPGLDCAFLLRDTEPASLLVELSKAADLVVLGTHRMGRLRGFVLGSVSQRVAAHAACPVVTVSGPAEDEGAPIVLGVSASPGGMAAMRFAGEAARLRNVPVRALRSITAEDWALSGPAYSIPVTRDALRDAARAELDTVLREARAAYPDVEITGEVTDADPFTALLKAAADASLVVIGSRRSQASALPHLGPVAAWLLHQAQCPLAVVGYTAQQTADAAAEPAAHVTSV